MRHTDLSLSQARRVALGSQGLLGRRPAAPAARHVVAAVDRTQVLQIDSVNVLQRAHYVPLMSRLGPYDTAVLDRATGRAPRRLVEYWAHVAAFMPVELWPLMQHRMAHYRAHGHEWMSHRPELVARLVGELEQRGPSTARELDDGLPRSREHWGWNWSETKKVLEYLFVSGEVAVARRNAAFERVYDLPDRVLPARVLRAEEPPREEAERELVLRAARAHGIASVRCLADYFRLPGAVARRAVAELVESGDLDPVRVEGWDEPTYLHRDARVPGRAEVRALLSPFDPVVWERRRTERLFGFRYRIEIYVPRERRVHGYYVLPFLLGERLVARVDLKADRARGALLVRSAHAEGHAPPETASELAGALTQLAQWLGLHEIVAAGPGDLMPALARSVASP
jgi:uncharacterized protein